MQCRFFVDLKGTEIYGYQKLIYVKENPIRRCKCGSVQVINRNISRCHQNEPFLIITLEELGVRTVQVKKNLDESDGGVLGSLLSMSARVSAPTNMQNHWRGKGNFELVYLLGYLGT